jgi:hypothetical protein
MANDFTLGIMQPYFFPYLGYFSLIHAVDEFILFDDVQYERKSWMSRNRLLNIEKNEPFYIRPGYKKPPYQANLTTVYLEEDEGWKNKLMDQFHGYKNKADYYEETKAILEDILSKNFEKLVELNTESIKYIASALGLKAKITKYSDYGFWFEEKPTAATWSLKIAEARDATHYVNSPGGESFIKPEGFTEAGIKLGFIQPNLVEYDQKAQDFHPGLSVIDVLAFNGVESTKEMLKAYTIKWDN